MTIFYPWHALAAVCVWVYGTSLFRFSAPGEIVNGGWLEIRNDSALETLIGRLSQFYVVHLLTVSL
ncbi:hypothetical protein FOTG_05500 [Fusarium oxysporum f. sp. vasinfectum 25433]|uniref:Uncharacterized protein n=1 Tax=Fusarium oxysporum f. sp. vasinfectum 25433 TaxID=1089449 RepID=X0N9P8_FUSOX|nr:hypothetical protein FOTG_05500 [Fusarium oxysporum f. sp. vasinfectum 25433]